MLFGMEQMREEIELFLAKLAPNQRQKDAIRHASEDALNKILNEAKAQHKTPEMILLTAICGELKTTQQKADFVSRLILMNLLLHELPGKF
jgi:hypothetical protein